MIILVLVLILLAICFPDFVGALIGYGIVITVICTVAAIAIGGIAMIAGTL